MSTCPETDLLSIYLDGELEEQYRPELEKHLTECESCRRKFAALEKTNKLIEKDAENIKYNQMEEGFARLQARKSYHTVTSIQDRKNTFRPRQWIIPAGIAAALMLFVILPFKHNGRIEDMENPFKGVLQQAQQVSLMNERGVARDKSLSHAYPLLEKHFTNAAVDIFKPALSSGTIQININLSGVGNFNDDMEDDIMVPVIFSRDIRDRIK